MSEFGTLVNDNTIRFERVLPGPIERVWDYLTDSDLRGTWLASGKMEPRVGGAVVLHFDHMNLSPHKAPTPERFKQMEGGVTGHHVVTRWEPPHVLAITWGEDIGDDTAEAIFELTPQGENVLLVLTTRRLKGLSELAGNAHGWHTHLAVLTERLNGRVPDAFWTLHSLNDGVYEKRFGKN